MFLKTFWYAAAWSNEIEHSLFARTICNEPMILYRTQAGNVVCMEDRCCHRRLPLHMGRLIGDSVQCHYHGLIFEPQGRCVKVPGQELIPPSAQLRTFAAAERHGLVWVFLGPKDIADEAKSPDHHWITDYNWGAKGTHFNVKANYMLIVENLLDLTHLAFVHASTIGNAAVVESAAVQFKRGPDSVDKNITLRNLNIITPESETSSHYFCAQCHDFDVKNQALTDMLFDDVNAAFRQDVDVFEAQQQSIAGRPDAPEVDVHGDIGGLHARRIIRELIERQLAGG